ncbi:hypothetical protein M422DRAFT_49485 [Sphaerobolus stellatus SS14]|uniref:Uncharacterized protein n=1 Tax=Sphaerobolus stellatus (strain SS14) TaxID=990650 RepID=A0A0C9VED3_SPHS4|nr:hypothetical protein M422DRAFT_49485 [Sphaerobolus stellatus SS14]
MYEWLTDLELPVMGPLLNYLLTGDYVYAGVVEQPSAVEMAHMIKRVHAAPLSALIHMKIMVSQSEMQPQQDKSRLKAHQELLAERLSYIMDYLCRQFSEDDQRAMGLDYIMLEHTLCKFNVRREQHLSTYKRNPSFNQLDCRYYSRNSNVEAENDEVEGATKLHLLSNTR